MWWNDGNNDYDKIMRTRTVKLPSLNTKKLWPWSLKREKKGFKRQIENNGSKH